MEHPDWPARSIAEVSGNGALSFNQRALYYVVRVLVPGLDDGYFARDRHGLRKRARRNPRDVP